MYRRLFERYFGCTVTEADDGPDGLRLIAETHPDLAVLDVELPSMSGTELLETIRATPDIADTPCIVVTSANQRPTIERLIAGNVLLILLKPVDLSRDVPRIESVFARLKARS